MIKITQHKHSSSLSKSINLLGELPKHSSMIVFLDIFFRKSFGNIQSHFRKRFEFILSKKLMSVLLFCSWIFPKGDSNNYNMIYVDFVSQPCSNSQFWTKTNSSIKRSQFKFLKTLSPLLSSNQRNSLVK